jgi:hypothetical protein
MKWIYGITYSSLALNNRYREVYVGRRLGILLANNKAL